MVGDAAVFPSMGHHKRLCLLGRTKDIKVIAVTVQNMVQTIFGRKILPDELAAGVQHLAGTWITVPEKTKRSKSRCFCVIDASFRLGTPPPLSVLPSPDSRAIACSGAYRRGSCRPRRRV
jgi:hypothetical protein